MIPGLALGKEIQFQRTGEYYELRRTPGFLQDENPLTLSAMRRLPQPIAMRQRESKPVCQVLRPGHLAAFGELPTHRSLKDASTKQFATGRMFQSTMRGSFPAYMR